MNGPERLESDILIVGGGPAGLVMGLCLARLGIGSTIVERHAGINEHPKAHELNARSIEILTMLGISMDELAKEASPPEDGCRIAFAMRINEEFGSIDLYRDIEDPEKYARHLASPIPYLNISQTEIERILFARVSAEPLIDLKMEHQWESHAQDGDLVRSEILNRKSGETFSIRSRFLIAADGAGSRIRKALGIAMLGPEKLQDVISAYFEANLRDVVARPAKLYWALEPDVFGTFIAHHIDKRWVFHLPIYQPWETADDFPPEAMAERIKRALGRDDLDIEIKSSSVWRMTMQVAERWRSGPAFLVGDAAHRFPPTGGLGMNTGIADVHNLAWKLAAVLKQGAAEGLLDSYESERRPVSERNGEESLENFERIFDVVEALGAPRKGGELLARLKKNRLFRLLPEKWRDGLIARLHRFAARKMRRYQKDPSRREKIEQAVREQIPHFDRIGLDIGYVYETGALVPNGSPASPPQVTSYEPQTAPGARFPHMWLRGEQGQYSSHALFDYDQWTLLSARPATEWVDARGNCMIKPISIGEIEADQASREQLQDLCEIGAEGAILVRPDGHVAWRTSNKLINPSETISTIFHQCGVT